MDFIKQSALSSFKDHSFIHLESQSNELCTFNEIGFHEFSKIEIKPSERFDRVFIHETKKQLIGFVNSAWAGHFVAIVGFEKSSIFFTEVVNELPCFLQLLLK